MANAGLSMRGAREMEKKLRSLAKELKEDAKSAALEEGQAILTRSREEFVPVDEGDLRDDSGVEVREDGNDVVVEIWYGRGESAGYALAVHENPSQHDPPTWRGRGVNFNPSGRGPKFLERPLMDAEDGLLARIGNKIFGNS